MAQLTPVTNADANAYFATTPRDAEWIATTSQDIWLTEAWRMLSTLCFDDTAACCGPSFADAWVSSNSELALALSKSPNAILGGGAASGGTMGAIKEQKLGGLSQSFYDVKDGTVSTSRFGPNDPLVLVKFPWLYELLKCYLVGITSGSSGLILRVRS